MVVKQESADEEDEREEEWQTALWTRWVGCLLSTGRQGMVRGSIPDGGATQTSLLFSQEALRDGRPSCIILYPGIKIKYTRAGLTKNS